MNAVAEQIRPVVDIQWIPEADYRTALFKQVLQDGRKGLFRQDPSFNDFADYFNRQEYLPDFLIPSFFYFKKEQFRGYETGNAVNYLAKVGEGIVGGFEEKAYQETIDNLVSLVAEYPLAETTKIEKRTFKWDDDWHLRTISGRMDEILSDALSSSQSEDFERLRFEANQRNYETLRKARAGGNRQTFVEFSPSPEPSSAATARGYLGNDCVFFYSLNDRGEEVVTQRWLKTRWKNFEDLLHGLKLDEQRRVTDVDIMNASDFFDENQIQIIKQFIDDNNGVLMEHREEIETYVREDLRPFIEKDVVQILIDGANDLIAGKDVTGKCADLIKSLTYAQARIRGYIAEITGFNTLPARMSTYYRNTFNQIDFKRMDTDHDFRVLFLQENRTELKLAGCGTNTQENDPIFGGKSGSFGLFGNSGVMNSLASLANSGSFGEGEDFPCPECRKMLGEGERKSGKCGGCGITKEVLAKKNGVAECG